VDIGRVDPATGFQDMNDAADNPGAHRREGFGRSCAPQAICTMCALLRLNSMALRNVQAQLDSGQIILLRMPAASLRSKYADKVVRYHR
jgi:hypothetical protein